MLRCFKSLISLPAGLFVYRSHDLIAVSWLANIPANQLFRPIRSIYPHPVSSRMSFTCIKQNTDGWLTCLRSDGSGREELWGAGQTKEEQTKLSWIWKVRWVSVLRMWILFSGLTVGVNGKEKEGRVEMSCLSGLVGQASDCAI